MDERIIEACSNGSMTGTMTFPEVVERLQAAGVQRYHVDLAGLRKTHYGVDDTVADVAVALTEPPTIGDAFVSTEIEAALRATQQGAIGYPEFLRRIMSSGAVAYTVYLDGGKTVYIGRRGDLIVEPFPTPR